MLLFNFAGEGPWLLLSDSMAKYVRVQSATVSAFRGDTISRLTDRIRFGDVDVSGFTRILIHVGTNDISNMTEGVTLGEILRRFKTLRSMIRRRNSAAMLLISSLLPRNLQFRKFKSYMYGLNFAIEKWCSKSSGACVFIPSYRAFLADGVPRAELFARDGLHLNGAGTDRLEACFQQAFSSGYLEERVRSDRVVKLSKVCY